jgi:hypothetical protein
MKRVFIESPAFEKAVKAMRISDEQVRDLQNDIMAGLGDIIPGTGGIKKVRWAARGAGKRGGLRVIFADYERYRLTLLLAAYSKTVRENLTRREANEWKKIKARLDQRIRETHGQRP